MHMTTEPAFAVTGRRQRFAGRVLASAVLGAAVWHTAAAADLRVGSPAPALDAAHWFWSAAGAGPITTFEPDRVYVVVFLAIRSPACRDAIVHLAKTQERHAADRVAIVAVDDEEVRTIEKFLHEPAGNGPVGASTATYRLATDPDGSIRRDYMEAAGRCGVPMAFIVGRTGQLEWVGHPQDLDDPLARVLDGTWDREAYAVRMAKLAEVGARLSEAVRLLEAGKGGTVVDLVDELIAAETNPDLTSQLWAIRDGLANTLSNRGQPANLLNNMAWRVVEFGQAGRTPPSELVAPALAAAEKAVALTAAAPNVEVEPEKGNIMDTLAHLQAMNGDFAAALATQRKAAEHAGTYAEPINEYLMELEKLAAGE